MKKLISIIVPVYNAEKYLMKCLHSIMRQTYEYLEILLIDDGSSDTSGTICDECAVKDKRVKVIHTKNHGVSHARNVGIEKSKGDLIIFIDSDDYIDINMIETLKTNLDTANADISMCNIIRVDKSGKQLDNYIDGKKPKIIIMDEKEYIESIQDYKMYFTYATNKLIKKSIINNLRFNEKIHYSEDGLFFLELANRIKKAVYIGPVKLYYYVSSDSSVNKNRFNDRYLTILVAYKEIEKYFEQFNEKCKCYFANRYINSFIDANYYLYTKKRLDKSAKKEYKRVMKKYFNYAIKSDEISLKKKIKLCIKRMLPIISMKMKYNWFPNN